MQYGHLPGIDKPISRLVQGTVPLDRGDLDGSFALLDAVYEMGCNRDNLDTFPDDLERLCVNSYCYEDNFRRLDCAVALAEAKGLTLPQVALAYVLGQPLNIFALVGWRSGAEFAENVAALDVQLTADEMAWLELSCDAL
jgi:hypothetical protein